MHRMKIKLNYFVGTAFLFLLFGMASAVRAQDGPIAGGYGETSVDDEGVVAAAKFAVKKRAAATKSKLSLLAIKNAKVQVVAGMNYQVCLEISLKRRSGKPVAQFVQVVVYRNLKNEYSLTRWTTLKDSSGC